MTAPSDHAQEIARWRAARERRLRASDGWLTLVDRRILDEGGNELPPGTFIVQDGQARFRPRPGAAVSLDGRLLPTAGAGAEIELRSEEGGPTDRLIHEGRSYELFRRGDVFAVRVKDPRATSLGAFRGIDSYPVDPRWRIVARFDRYDPPRHTVHQYDIGPGRRREVPGVARFAVVAVGDDGGPASVELSLEPVLEEESNRLFFVFADRTNRHDTYEAGRFLYAPVPGRDEREVVLDFNTAFNPPCAFTPYATCPVTPPQNRLPIAITAGERRHLTPAAT